MKNERGITLLVLVISIIIMLILAGIVITTLLKDDGIFKNAGTAKIMSKVEVLDDAIKAYTIKNKDPYSSSSKSIDDLIEEGILKKITLTGDDIESDKDDKIIYYVNFEKEFENKEDSVAALLGLKSDEYENSKKLNEFTYTNLEELQDKGIYVVDNDLNAAYLENSKTYGKLVNFGILEEDQYIAEFGQQTLTLRVNKKAQEPQQEVIFILDRSPSMVAPQDVNGNPARVYDSAGNFYSQINPKDIDWDVTWNKTRWSGIVNAADIFCDTYFDGSTGNRALTIYTYYGQSANGKVTLDGIENLGTFINANDAKNSYANICSKQQYIFAMKKLTQEYFNRYQILGNHDNTVKQIYDTFADKPNWGAGDRPITYKTEKIKKVVNGKEKTVEVTTYNIDCGVFQYNFMLSGFWGNSFTDNWTKETYNAHQKATFGPGTCTPNALLKVEKEYLKSNSRPKDIIILTDGDSGSFWDECFNRSINFADNANSIAKIAERIMSPANAIGEHNTGIYPIAYGPAVSKFKGTFSGHFSDFYTAGNEQQLAENFKTILDNIIVKMETQTDTSQSHTLQYIENGTTKDYEQEGVYKIVLELRNSKTGKASRTITYDINGTGAGDIRPLTNVYENNKVKLERTWQDYFGNNPAELDDYQEKIITIYIE